MTINDFENNKRKVSCDNADLLRAVGELSNSLQMIQTAKSALASQLDDVKARADNEVTGEKLKYIILIQIVGQRKRSSSGQVP